MRKYGLQPPPPPPEAATAPVEKIKQTTPLVTNKTPTHAPVTKAPAKKEEHTEQQIVIINSQEDKEFTKIPKDIINDKDATIGVYPQYLMNKPNFENFIKYNGITVNKINPLSDDDAGRDALLKLINYIENIINSIDPRNPNNKNAPGF